MNTSLTLTSINGEPRIHDLQLAERLGFAEPRMIRNLIKRNHDKLLNFGVCYTVEQTSGAQGGRPATEFYLNQKQAIFICMKSETDRAFDVQAEIVRVFDAYLTGALKLVFPDGSTPAVTRPPEQTITLSLKEFMAMQNERISVFRQANRAWRHLANAHRRYIALLEQSRQLSLGI